MKKIALCILTILFALPVQAQNLQSIRTISVSGSAERSIVPDEAHLGVNLNAIDKKLAVAKSAHDAKLVKLLAIIKSAGIEEKKVKTNTSNVQPEYTYENSVQTFKGYRVQSNLDIMISDIKKVADLSDKIANAGFENGANTQWGNLLSLSYTVSNPDEVRDSLLAEAIKNARTKAERMAEAAGARVKRVYQINESSVPQFQPVMAMAKSESNSDAAIAPPTGEQELQSSVTVIYEIE